MKKVHGVKKISWWETIIVHLSTTTNSSSTATTINIQSTCRSHRVRTLIKEILSVNLQVTHFERLIQRQETVDAVRTDSRKTIKMNEALMGMLLRLDSSDLLRSKISPGSSAAVAFTKPLPMSKGVAGD
ncbi:hypothetical protein RJ640_013532 [Escallonia rubra]|uniref:Uncharacterized protein n=1 Tax=Escallonia rubra TaxID=112253 RepID=A0AA88RZX1_9ASTE|nr:hypothetical protein RJ640_013532 [Escallonia rubra]